VNAEAKILEHMAAAMDRILNPPAPKVRFEPHPLDFCDVCGAKDKYDSFAHDFQNGREIALCDECQRDPAPYCSFGHKTKAQCDCGDIADNE
jgi:hypothetical protein